jgi:hypothetical protein
MALMIKRFKTALKGRKVYSNENKSRRKHSCFKCGKTNHLLLTILIMRMARDKTRQDKTRKGR